jgi:hypothetical protein
MLRKQKKSCGSRCSKKFPNGSDERTAKLAMAPLHVREEMKMPREVVRMNQMTGRAEMTAKNSVRAHLLQEERHRRIRPRIPYGVRIVRMCRWTSSHNLLPLQQAPRPTAN